MNKKIKIFLIIFALSFLVSCNSKTSTSLQIGVITLNNQGSSKNTDAEKVIMYFSDNKGAKKSANYILSEGGFKYFNNLNSALLSLDNNEIGSLILPEYSVNYLIKNNVSKYNRTKTKAKVVLSMAGYPSHEALLVQIGKTIIQLNDENILPELIAKYITAPNTQYDNQNQELPFFENGKTIRVVLTGDLPPIDYIDSTNNPKGFSIALLTEIAKILEVNFQVVIGDASQRQSLIKSDKADIAFWMCGVTTNGLDNIDYSSDVPKDMIVSIPYLQCDYDLLSLQK